MICNRLLQILKLCAVPAHSLFLMLLGQWHFERVCLEKVSKMLTTATLCSVFVQSLKEVAYMYKHSLWGVEGPLHEQDPGHHHGEHVLHPRRHLVGGRRSEVDVQHPHLRIRIEMMAEL